MSQPDSNNNQLLKTEEKGWYDLFSRGARDWLRHNDKVRESVMDRLPEIIADTDVISRPENRKVQIPVKFLEHYRFRLSDTNEKKGIGQGEQGAVNPGDVLRPGQDQGKKGNGQGGTGGGGYNFILELNIDDIVEWLWEELELPNLKPKKGESLTDDDYVREGWDKRGVRSRLDRRRTLKEAIKRRSVQGEDSPAIVNDDLRFRQLASRKQPANNAVIFFVLDASSSMTQDDRKMAKTLFFWILQGLRRQYTKLEVVFIAHTGKAWEFTEEEFFSVTAEGGTEASVAFRLVQDIFKTRYNPESYNGYLFYASDGDNFFGDRNACETLLTELGYLMNYMGYAEISQSRVQALHTEMGIIFNNLVKVGHFVGSVPIKKHEDIWPAIKAFFKQQTELEAA